MIVKYPSVTRLDYRDHRIRTKYLSVKKMFTNSCVLYVNENKSPGSDNIQPVVLKKLAEVWTYPLTTLLYKSPHTGNLPSDWLHVTPIFKKESISDVGNYRPVALTSIPCKMLEHIIRNSLVEHIEVNSLFSKDQHSFSKNRSCLTNLLETLEEWTDTTENGYSLDILFLDYQKAFDTVPHQTHGKNCVATEYTLHYYPGYVNSLAKYQ